LEKSPKNVRLLCDENKAVEMINAKKQQEGAAILG
jgi:hypothetical protein